MGRSFLGKGEGGVYRSVGVSECRGVGVWRGLPGTVLRDSGALVPGEGMMLQSRRDAALVTLGGTLCLSYVSLT